MHQKTVDENAAFDRVIRPWWAKLAIGLLMLAIAVWTYSACAAVDAGEETAESLMKGARFLYSVGGAWLAAGVPFAVGAGFVAWGLYQLARMGPGSPVHREQSIHVRVARDSADSDDAELGYAQSVYITFWKAIFLCVAVVNIALAMLIVRTVTPDAGQYAFIVALLLAVLAAYVELWLFERATRWSEGPLFDFSKRATWIVVVGYAAALGLAGFLASSESSEDQYAEERKRERDAYYEKLRDPDVQRGIEAMKEMQRRKAPPPEQN